MSEDRDQGSDAAAAHTPGPWGWFGNNHGIYLATQHSGRQYVMGFRRMGMRRAQPEFQSNSLLIPASALVEFAVGDGKARGFEEGKADPSVYRYDITAIDHPDARLIAAAPDQNAVCMELHRLSLVIESAVRNSDPGNLGLIDKLIRSNKTAVAKAKS